MDLMNATDAGFYYAEGGNTPMHVGSVSVFDGPAPSYGDLVRLLLSKLPHVPRYRQRVRTVPFGLGRPAWVDDEHFQILYHVRHTAVPRPGGPEQLRNLAGRVLGHRLDMAKPLWESWLVEGLLGGQWAIISKVHHCMVDGIAGTDLLQLIYSVDPTSEHPDPAPWSPRPGPSIVALTAASVSDALVLPIRHIGGLVRDIATDPRRTAGQLVRSASVLGQTAPTVLRQALRRPAIGLDGRIGPHRRWIWAETSISDITKVRQGLGGTVNDVVLAAISRGFRDLLAGRGGLNDGLVVRTMVPVSVRQQDERGVLNNELVAVLVDLPVGQPDPVRRLTAVREQMEQYKHALDVVDARSIIAMEDFVAPTLLALGTRVGARSIQPIAQAVTTNVPGPRVPLYALGRRLRSLYAYVPIAAGERVSIGIYSYVGQVTFGINTDFDAFPDVEVLGKAICLGMAELIDAAGGASARASVTGSDGASAVAASPEVSAVGASRRRPRRMATSRASSSRPRR
jgi:WS/DGAT/MGAT family acyltransferase